jgi:hypothetical protein
MLLNKISFKWATKASIYFGVILLLFASLGLATVFYPASQNKSDTSWFAEELIANLQRMHSDGEIQNGHDSLVCLDCHQKSDGNIRQQLQAIAHNYLIENVYKVNFAFAPVDSQNCIDCHQRANERHPIYRFNEPRFIEALDEVKANTCLGCHSEHKDERVSFVQVSFCSSCHEDLKMKNDPLDIKHEQIVAEDNWGSCLGCHDFHGNHIRSTPVTLDSAFNQNLIKDYFANGASPYGEIKTYLGEIDNE